VPKEVDHAARQRELADAACRVIARNGLAGTTLADVAVESGWSIGSIRHYFPNKDALVGSALWRVGERVDDRIRRRTAGGMTMNDLRVAATELLPLDELELLLLDALLPLGNELPLLELEPPHAVRQTTTEESITTKHCLRIVTVGPIGAREEMRKAIGGVVGWM